MKVDIDEVNHCSGQVVDAAMKVHAALGPGLLETAYEACLAYELRRRGLAVRRQVPIPILYDGQKIRVGYRADLLADDMVLIELKAIASVLPIHEAQVLSYLNLGGFKVGLLINFNVRRLKDGIRRLVNNA